MASNCFPLHGLPKDSLLTNLVVNDIAVFRCKTVASNLQVRNTFQFAGGEDGDVLTNVGGGQAEWLPSQGGTDLSLRLEDLGGLPIAGPVPIVNGTDIVFKGPTTLLDTVTHVGNVVTV